jgi:hypothetical protein
VKIAAAAAREQQALGRIAACIALQACSLKQPSGTRDCNWGKSQRNRWTFNPQ